MQLYINTPLLPFLEHVYMCTELSVYVVSKHNKNKRFCISVGVSGKMCIFYSTTTNIIYTDVFNNTIIEKDNK